MATAPLPVLLKDRPLFLLFVEKFPPLLIAAWGQTGWEGRAHEVTFNERKSVMWGRAPPGLHVRPWHIVGAQEMRVLTAFMSEAWHFHSWSYQLSEGRPSWWRVDSPWM